MVSKWDRNFILIDINKLMFMPVNAQTVANSHCTAHSLFLYVLLQQTRYYHTALNCLFFFFLMQVNGQLQKGMF